MRQVGSEGAYTEPHARVDHRLAVVVPIPRALCAQRAVAPDVNCEDGREDWAFAPVSARPLTALPSAYERAWQETQAHDTASQRGFEFTAARTVNGIVRVAVHDHRLICVARWRFFVAWIHFSMDVDR